MDLYNNAVGREIGMNNPNASDNELLGLVSDALNNNELMTNIPEKTEATYRYGDGIRDSFQPRNDEM